MATGTQAQVAVIANRSVPVEAIEKSKLLDLYLGDKTFWDDGQPAIVFDLKKKGETKRAYYRYLGVRYSRIRSTWLKRMLSGDSGRLKSYESEEEMLKKVASTPGAVGFVSQAKVSDDVKTILVIEKTAPSRPPGAAER